MYTINPHSILNIVASLFSFGIGVFVYRKNPKSDINFSFFLLALAAAVWKFGDFMLLNASNAETATLWCKNVYLGSIFIPISTYFFSVAFLRLKKQKKFILPLYLIGALVWVPLSRTSFFVSGVREYYWGYWYASSPSFVVYLVFFTALMVISFYNFCRGYISSKSMVERTRIRYVFIAFLIAYIGSVDYLPNYNISVYPFGHLTVMVYIFIIAYAIVRHQLMNIEVIIKKTLVFAGLFVVAYTVLAGFAYLGSLVFENVIRNRWVAIAPALLIVVLILRPLENFLRATTDKYLFQKKYDYKKLLKTFTGEVLTVLGLNELVNLTVNRLADTIKLENTAILLHDEEHEIYKIVSSIGLKKHGFFLDKDSMISYMRDTGEHILLDEHGRKNDKYEIVETKVRELGAELVIPLMHSNDLIGILSLGKKKSDEEFTQDDIDILLPLAKTLSIAISNAQLFEKLSQAQAQAAQREKMAVIGTLSAGINHEICNPLGIVRGQCEMFLLNLKEGIYDDKSPGELLDKAQEIMNKVIHETDRATVITRKLSTFAKPAKRKMEEAISVEDELDEVISLVGHDLTLDNIVIEKDIEEDIAPISADRKQVQEIFFNIIRNAAQAIESPGKIIIKMTDHNEKVHIEIKDTGVGMEKGQLAQIFNPFFTTKEPGQGTGLGLFIVKQIVEKNKGHIMVESVPGEGTSFFLTFNAASKGEIAKHDEAEDFIN